MAVYMRVCEGIHAESARVMAKEYGCESDELSQLDVSDERENLMELYLYTVHFVVGVYDVPSVGIIDCRRWSQYLEYN